MATNFSGFLTIISFAVVADGIAIAIPLIRRLLPLLLGCCLATSTRILTLYRPWVFMQGLQLGRRIHLDSLHARTRPRTTYVSNLHCSRHSVCRFIGTLGKPEYLKENLNPQTLKPSKCLPILTTPLPILLGVVMAIESR